MRRRATADGVRKPQGGRHENQGQSRHHHRRARGIGKAIAERYIQEGAKVVIADLNEAGAKAVAAGLGPNALGLKLDITEQASIDATIAATVVHFGRIDILVNNAGMFDLAPILEITRESYHRVYAVNVEGLLFMLQAAARQMIKQGHGGKIINFASQAGRRGEALVAIYCSSKAAVISLTQSAGLDLIKHHINVNAIAPGVVDNEHWEHVDEMFAKYEHLPHGEKKRVVGAVGAVRPHGASRRDRRSRHVPRQRGRRLHRRADLQHRRRQLDELSDEVDRRDRRDPRRDHGDRAGDGFLEPVKLIGPFPSGAPAIFIDQAARFGQPAAMIGCVGDDDFGRVNINCLRRDGVDVSAVRIDPEAVTGSAFVRYRTDGSRAFVFNIKQSAAGRLELDEAARSVLSRGDHLHVMGTVLFSPKIVGIVLKAVETVKARGGTISFDPNLRPEMLNLPGLREACGGLFRRCDLFLPSGAELSLFTSATEESAAIAEIFAGGVRAVIHKRGAEGASYCDPDKPDPAGVRGRGDRSDRGRRLLRRDVRKLLVA